ncbi:hypothetical protein [Hyphomicrobium zavarzinii]|uniref:hypothetical protein n=1 Tax=Hyphomicrobium zavarzinii TaxID=48292 RepID=UPI000379C0F1|nr:hypothetical protein [Hyphomicrobium zavarzinii]
MTTHTTTWRVPPWAYLPLGAAIIAEASVNALRAYGLGMQLEHFTVNVAAFGFEATVSIAGVVLVLAAIAMSLSQARAAWVAFKPGALARQRTIAAPIALLLLTVSVAALALTLLEAQRGKTGDEGGQRTAYDIAKADYDKASAEWKRLEGARTPAEVQAAMSVAPVDRTVFRRTKECNDVTRQDSFEACKPILELRQEMAGAIRKIELEQKLPGLKAKLDALPRPAEPTWFEVYAASGWAWAFGLAAVLIATFGAPLFAEPREETEADRWNARKPWAGQLAQPSVKDTLQSSFPVAGLLDNGGNSGNHGAVGPGQPKRPDDGNSGNGGNRRGPKPDNPRNGGNRPSSRVEFERDVVTRLALGHSIDSQDALADAHHVNKGTASKWLKDMRERGLIPAAQRVGRCHRLVAAE